MLQGFWGRQDGQHVQPLEIRIQIQTVQHLCTLHRPLFDHDTGSLHCSLDKFGSRVDAGAKAAM